MSGVFVMNRYKFSALLIALFLLNACSGNATKDIMNIQSWISQWFKDNFLSKTMTTNKKKIYIDRSNKNLNKPAQRLITNEDEVKKYLLKNNFVSIMLSDFYTK